MNLLKIIILFSLIYIFLNEKTNKKYIVLTIIILLSLYWYKNQLENFDVNEILTNIENKEKINDIIIENSVASENIDNFNNYVSDKIKNTDNITQKMIGDIAQERRDEIETLLNEEKEGESPILSEEQ